MARMIDEHSQPRMYTMVHSIRFSIRFMFHVRTRTYICMYDRGFAEPGLLDNDMA